jgi:hypothetical protein
MEWGNNGKLGSKRIPFHHTHYSIIPIGAKPQSPILDLLKEKGLYLNVFRLIFWKKDDVEI